MDQPSLSLKRRLASGGAWALGGKALLALTGLATNALLGRLLSPQDLGIFFLAFSVVSFCTLLSLLGLEIAVVRFVAESLGLGRPQRARRAITRILILGTSGSLAVGAAYMLFGAPLVTRLFQAPALAAVSGLIVGWILATTFQSLMAETFRGLSDIRLATLFSRSTTGFGSLASGLILTVGLAALWFSEGRTDLVTVIFLAVGSGVSGTLLASLFLRGKLRRMPATESPETEVAFGKVMRVAWPLLLTNLMLFAITQSDLWIVGAFRPQEEVALYGAAARLVALTITPLLVVNAVVAPFIPESYARGETDRLEEILRTTATLAGIPAFLALMGFIFFGDSILGIVFGEYYRDGAFILTVLTMGNLVLVWAGSCGVVLVLLDRQLLMMAITVASGIVTIGAAIVAVNYFGAQGVAVTSALGLALQSILMWLGVKQTTGMWTHCDLKILSKLVKSAFKPGD